MLASHPCVAGPHEFPLIARALDHFSLNRDATAETFLDLIYAESSFCSWEVPREEVEAQLSGIQSGARIVIEAIINVYLRKHGARYFVDKNILYLEILPLLKALFPNARFLFIVRDGRDVALSLKERSWGSYRLRPYPSRCLRHLKGGGLVWLDALALVESFRRCFQPNLTVVRYEDLVSAPSTELSRLCSFLDIQFHANMLDYHREPDPTISGNSLRLNHALVEREVTTDRSTRFLKSMPATTLAALTYSLKAQLLQYGYSVGEARPLLSFSAGYVLRRRMTQVLSVLRRVFRQSRSLSI